MSDQQPPALVAQLVDGGGTPSAVDPVAASGAGTPEDHFNPRRLPADPVAATAPAASGAKAPEPAGPFRRS